MNSQIEKRFEQKYNVDTISGCWIWRASIGSHGYGQFWDGRVVLAHRWAYEHFLKKIPSGLEIDHLCKNKRCVNPQHLEPVTHQVNACRADAGKKTGAKQRAKTRCPRGHTYTEANTYTHNEKRQCRKCRQIRKTSQLRKSLATESRLADQRAQKNERSQHRRQSSRSASASKATKL